MSPSGLQVQDLLDHIPISFLLCIIFSKATTMEPRVADKLGSPTERGEGWKNRKWKQAEKILTPLFHSSLSI
jgi:hypothetical protein